MKEIKWTRKNTLIWCGSLTILGLILYVYGTYASLGIGKHGEELLNNREYAVGTVKTFFIPNNPPEPYLRFTYNVNGIEIVGRDYYRFPPRVVEAGDRYIVVYSSKNARNSMLLFAYPIKEDGDFEKYLEQFKRSPPGFRPTRRLIIRPPNELNITR